MYRELQKRLYFREKLKAVQNRHFRYPPWALALAVHKQVLLHFSYLNGEQVQVIQNFVEKHD